MNLETLLISAVIALSSGIVALWKIGNDEKREAARLIFALLQRQALSRGETPPPTNSTPESPQLIEAQRLAVRALNGEIEDLVKEFLRSSPPGRR